MTDTTHLDELIKAEREKANKRIAKLRSAAATQQRKLDGKVVELLQKQKPDLYGRLADEARAALDAEKAERSRKAKASGVTGTEEPRARDAVADEHPEEVRHQWNG